MKIFIRRKNGDVDAVAEYEERAGNVKVLKGSKVSQHISDSPKFRGIKTIEKLRSEYVIEDRVKEDVIFKSPSTAANFVTGSSTNGLIAWKDENGRALKSLIKKEENR